MHEIAEGSGRMLKVYGERRGIGEGNEKALGGIPGVSGEVLAGSEFQTAREEGTS
jgi:hypothetical protein